MKVIFAGAGSLFGIKDIKKSVQELNIDVEFIENYFMSKNLTDEDREEVKLVEKYIFDKNVIVIPTNEYWLSECISQNIGNISEKAKKASRDKTYFNQCLIDDGIITSTQLCYNDVCRTDGLYVVKPKYAYSGKGVSICINKDVESLRESIDFAKIDIANTTSITKVFDNDVSYWKYEEGMEYSVDLFYYRGEVNVIRLCEKVVRIINKRPCTLGYRLINPEESITKVIKSWCNSVFAKDDISFAQFDFIKRQLENVYIPIDFASRVAGGLHNLLRELDYNPYINALQSKYYFVSKNYTQINLISSVPGKIISDEYNIPILKCYKNKKIGDFVTSDITSCSNRLAEFICISSTRRDFEEKAELGLRGEDYVS